jgi:hypothetical protein
MGSVAKELSGAESEAECIPLFPPKLDEGNTAAAPADKRQTTSRTNGAE